MPALTMAVEVRAAAVPRCECGAEVERGLAGVFAGSGVGGAGGASGCSLDVGGGGRGAGQGAVREVAVAGGVGGGGVGWDVPGGLRTALAGTLVGAASRTGVWPDKGLRGGSGSNARRVVWT